MSTLSRLRPSPAMAVALLALVVAMGGTAVAGSLIDGGDIKKGTVTGKQVKESSLGKVPKASGADKLTPLPAGQLMHGVFAAGASNEPATLEGYLGVGITFPRPLATPIADDHIVDIQGNAYTTECPGPGQAKSGYLCVYNKVYSGVDDGYGYGDLKYLKVDGQSIGALLFWYVVNDDPYVGGSWTLRAPNG